MRYKLFNNDCNIELDNLIGKKLNKNFVGIELNKEYFEIIKERMES